VNQHDTFKLARRLAAMSLALLPFIVMPACFATPGLSCVRTLAVAKSADL
jgi:hypothetical protein